jgi:hypothetical protein
MWKRFAAHPITPLGLGALLSFANPGLLVPKFVVLLLLWGWLSIDAWLWLKELTALGRFRNALVCALIASAGVGMLVADRAFLLQELHARQQDTFEHLSAVVTLPVSGDPYFSFFTVTNGATNRIIKHKMICGINVIVTVGYVILKGLNEIASSSDAPIEGDGDAQSDACLAFFRADNPRCVDVTLTFSYALEVQPELMGMKRFRFAGIQNAGAFMWNRQPVAQQQSYCAAFIGR